MLQNLKVGSVLDTFFLKMILSMSRKRWHQAKSYIFSVFWSKTPRKMVIKIDFTPLSLSWLSDCKMFPFKKGLKKEHHERDIPKLAGIKI